MKINVPKDTKIAFVGDIHESSKLYFKLLERLNPNPKLWLVSLGDVYDKGEGIEAAEKITDSFMDLKSRGYLYAVRGNHELKHIRKNRKNPNKYHVWWAAQPLVLEFSFTSGATVTALHAGVTPQMTRAGLTSSIEVCYTRTVDDQGMIPIRIEMIEGKKHFIETRPNGQYWYDLYDGRFGYIVSGHIEHESVEYHAYSCNIDTGAYRTGVLSAQIFDSQGNLDELVQVTND